MKSSQNVTPINPVAPYIGGKRNLARTIVGRIGAIEHRTYVEPFVGMGGVFLRRPERARSEVINDINRDLVTFYRVLQNHYVAFLEHVKFDITSRAAFERLTATDPDTLTDIQRAARFLYLQRTAFGGKPSGRNFGVAPDRPGRFDVTKLGAMLEDLHERLAGVVIECLPYGELIRRYDRPETLFYLDPPYWGCEAYYGKGRFEREDFKRLAEQLKGIRGNFLLSLNDLSETRETFRDFHVEAVRTTYTVAKAGGKRVGEIIVSNRPPAHDDTGGDLLAED